MRAIRVLSLMAAGALLMSTVAACSASGGATDEPDPQALASQLIDQYAVAVFERDQEALGSLLSDAYQLRRSDGSGYDRQGYVDALAEGSNYDLVDYTITDVKARQDGDVLVATFLLEAEILENGTPVTSEPSTSLVTFVRVDGQWKLASDAFFSK